MKLLGRALILILVVLISAWGGSTLVQAQGTQLPTPVAPPDIALFYSPTCPHCHKERAFLRDLATEHPELTIEEYSVFDPASEAVLLRFASSTGLAREALGAVPITFVRGIYLIGFESSETTGARIRDVLGLSTTATTTATTSVSGETTLPLMGRIQTERYPLLLLSALLGVLDGWNICSLGALALIIGLALSLGTRRDMALLGGTFLLVTALSYGVLIALWYALFSALCPYVGVLELMVGLVALIGSVYFFREYLRMRRMGPTCSLRTVSIVDAITRRTTSVVSRGASLMASLSIVGLFALIVTVIEFPCSAAIPVAFAGLLAERGVSSFAYLGYSTVFVFFYLLDELIIFSLAVYRLKLTVASPRGTKLVVLAEACVLFVFAAWYLGARVIG